MILVHVQKLQKQHNCIPDEHYVQTLLAVRYLDIYFIIIIYVGFGNVFFDWIYSCFCFIHKLLSLNVVIDVQ